MKNIFLFFCIVFVNVCNAQEWFTSLEIAKRLALVQDKMLFVMWEESTTYDYPIIVENDKGVKIHTDLFEDDKVNSLIWENFIPVIIPESKYPELSHNVKGKRGLTYYNKLNSEGIIIMDPSGYILNIKSTPELDQNLSLFIRRYSINTLYFKKELNNYSKKQNFSTSFRLAAKYLDYTTYVNKELRYELAELASIYFENAMVLLEQENFDNIEGFRQKGDLMIIKKALVLNKPRKVLRLLKKINSDEIDKINQSLFSFLHYTSYMLLNYENNAALWKTKVSLVDLRKANSIIKSNL